MKKKKSVAILGSTGSIGKASVDVIKKNKEFKIELIFANKNIKEIVKQIKHFSPKVVIVNNIDSYLKLKKKYIKKKIKILNDYKICKKYLKKVDVSISAIPGIAGLEPTIFFTKLSKRVLIANKESIICGWNIIKKNANKFKTEIIPIDSEHFSINFLLKKFSISEIKKIYITASGGPFFKLHIKHLKNINPNDAIKHPKWKMGKKISVDSATLMNKLLEVIEAIKLFSIRENQIEIVIHPQSLVHSIIELKNGLRVFLYHEPNMRIPISIALKSISEDTKTFKFYKKKINNNLDFFPIDKKKFPIVNLISKIDIKNSSPILLNAGNEIFVDEFLKKRIKFIDIYQYLNYFVRSNCYIESSKIRANSINNIKKIDLIGRNLAFKIINNKNV